MNVKEALHDANAALSIISENMGDSDDNPDLVEAVRMARGALGELVKRKVGTASGYSNIEDDIQTLLSEVRGLSGRMDDLEKKLDFKNKVQGILRSGAGKTKKKLSFNDMTPVQTLALIPEKTLT